MRTLPWAIIIGLACLAGLAIPLHGEEAPCTNDVTITGTAVDVKIATGPYILINATGARVPVQPLDSAGEPAPWVLASGRVVNRPLPFVPLNILKAALTARGVTNIQTSAQFLVTLRQSLVDGAVWVLQNGDYTGDQW